MKRSILFMILVALFSSGLLMATVPTIIVITKEPIPIGPGPQPLSVYVIPVSGTISDIELSLYFETTIGIATVTVTDDSNQVVYLGTVNTDTTSEIHVPVDLWTNGNYHLTITYTNTTLRGEFQLE